jgi:hypothetical protein
MAKKVKGNGQVTTMNHDLTGFREIELSGGMSLFLSQGPDYSVRIEAESNLMQYIEVEKDGSELEIGVKDGYNLRPSKGIRIYVTAPSFSDLSIAGSGSIRGETKISGNDNIDLSIAGSGSMLLDVQSPNISADISGSGSVLLSGATRAFDASITGSGDVKAFNLLSETAEVDITGGGNVEVAASRELDVDITGSGDVIYRGNPSLKTSRTGSGNVRRG